MDDKKTVWCGNLSEKVTEEILHELFLQAGPLERVIIPKDKYGKQRAFGFVTFKHECSVPYAIELFKGTCLYKRPLNLQSKHNGNTDTVQQSFGMTHSEGSETQRTPVYFGSMTPGPQDYGMLLQHRQLMLLLGTMARPNQHFSPVGTYASQMSSSRLSYEFSRNHPYNNDGGGGNDQNHSGNGRHNKPHNSRHRRDTSRSSNKKRR